MKPYLLKGHERPLNFVKYANKLDLTGEHSAPLCLRPRVSLLQVQPGRRSAYYLRKGVTAYRTAASTRLGPFQ